MSKFEDLGEAGCLIAVRATPKAARNRIVREGDVLRVYVTVAPEGGKANAAIVKLLSKAIGVPKSRLKLVRGESGRDKLFEVL